MPDKVFRKTFLQLEAGTFEELLRLMDAAAEKRWGASLGLAWVSRPTTASPMYRVQLEKVS